jgi:hypothetical protein
VGSGEDYRKKNVKFLFEIMARNAWTYWRKSWKSNEQIIIY